jgi:hypothetical protein
MNLKKYLDTQIGEQGYIQVRRHDDVYLCEGRVKDLRQNSLWSLIDEENVTYKCAFLDKSEAGHRCITIILRKGR